MQFKTITIYNIFEHTYDRTRLKKTINYILDYKLCSNELNPIQMGKIEDFSIDKVKQFSWNHGELTNIIYENYNNLLKPKILFCPPYRFSAYIDLNKKRYPNLWFDKNITSIGGVIEFSVQGFAIISVTTNFEIDISIDEYNPLEDKTYQKLTDNHKYVEKKIAHFKNIYSAPKYIKSSDNFSKSNIYLLEISEDNDIKQFNIEQVAYYDYFKLKINPNIIRQKQNIVFGIQLGLSHNFLLNEINMKFNTYFVKISNYPYFFRELLYLIYGSLNPIYYNNARIIPHNSTYAYEKILDLLNYQKKYSSFESNLVSYLQSLNNDEINIMIVENDEIANLLRNIFRSNMIRQFNVRVGLLDIHKKILTLFMIYYYALLTHNIKEFNRTKAYCSINKIWKIYKSIKKTMIEIPCHGLDSDPILMRTTKRNIKNSALFTNLTKNRFLISRPSPKGYIEYRLDFDNLFIKNYYNKVIQKISQCNEFLTRFLENIKKIDY